MKKNILLILTATAAYSYLFYLQNPGMNHLVFSLVLTTLFALNNSRVTKDYRWWLAAGAYVFSGIITALNGTPLNLLMNLGGIALLTYITVTAELSIITGVIYSGLSALCATLASAAVRFERYVSGTPTTEENTGKTYKWYYALIPLTVLIVFILLYRSASGAFTLLTDKIDLSFISFPWIVFTLVGFQFLYGLFNPPSQFDFFKREVSIPNELTKNAKWITRGFNLTGITLFLLLDFLLLVVNITDISYLFFIGKENVHMSHAEIIHQGIAALSVSVVFAVLFILLWLNQLKDDTGLRKKLSIAATAWVVLNIVLIATNTIKNYQYISAHGLTYLRIGVYFFLTLAMLTLFFCWVKIRGAKTNFFMYRRFGLALLFTCLVFNAFNWDKVIARYNIARYKDHTLEVDRDYMLGLSFHCLPILMENREFLNPNHENWFESALQSQARTFMERYEKVDWRSHSVNDNWVYDYLKHHPLVSTTPEVSEHYTETLYK